MKIQIEKVSLLLETRRRASDESDELIVSRSLARKAVLNGNGKIRKVDLAIFWAALKSDYDAQLSNFLRIWTRRRTVVCLAAEPLAFADEGFVNDWAALAAERLLIGLPDI